MVKYSLEKPRREIEDLVYMGHFIKERCSTRKELHNSDVLMIEVNNTFIFSFGLFANHSLNHRNPEIPVLRKVLHRMN